MSDKPFTFVSKNGKSFSFANGAELSSWYQSQKSRKKKKKSKKTKASKTTKGTGADVDNA